MRESCRFLRSSFLGLSVTNGLFGIFAIGLQKLVYDPTLPSMDFMNKVFNVGDWLVFGLAAGNLAAAIYEQVRSVRYNDGVEVAEEELSK